VRSRRPGYARPISAADADASGRNCPSKESRLSSHHHRRLTPEQNERLQAIRQRVVEARRELDALIGDAYLRPRANVVAVHFLDLAAAVEKLRWAEKEWRELDEGLAADAERGLEELLDARPVESTTR